MSTTALYSEDVEERQPHPGVQIISVSLDRPIINVNVRCVCVVVTFRSKLFNSLTCVVVLYRFAIRRQTT